MSPHSLVRLFATAAVLAVCVGAVALAGAATPADTGHAAAAATITGSGVGGVKLGKTYQSLHAAGLIGRLRKGCELAGPKARGARLHSPLKGGVTFTLNSPRKVTNIGINGGAKAHGVGIGATIAQIRAAFPKAQVDHSTEGTFALTLVRIPKSGGGRFVFGVETSTHKTSIIGIPVIAFCE